MNKKKAGYISIESILVVGLMLVVAVSVTIKNQDGSQKLVDTSLSAMDNLMDSYNSGSGDSSGGSSSGSGSSGSGSSGSGSGSGGSSSSGGIVIPDSFVTPNAMPTPRQSFATVTIDKKIYTIGGTVNGVTSQAFEVLDTTTGKWTKLTDFPLNYSSTLSMTTDSNAIYVSGNNENGSFFLSYSPRADIWIWSFENMDLYEGATVFLLNGSVAIVGGTFTDKTTGESYSNNKIMKIYNEEYTEIGTGRAGNCADIITVGDDIYMIGGTLTTSYQLYKYTSSSDTWTKVTNAPTRNVHKGYKTAYSDGYIYLLGGTTFYVYDIYLDTWKTLTSPTTSYTYHGMSVIGDYVYAFGGTAGANVSVYSISQNTWIA